MRPVRYPKTRDGQFQLPPTATDDGTSETDGILADPMTAAFAVTETETVEVPTPVESGPVSQGVIESLIEMQQDAADCGDGAQGGRDDSC